MARHGRWVDGWVDVWERLKAEGARICEIIYEPKLNVVVSDAFAINRRGGKA